MTRSAEITTKVYIDGGFQQGIAGWGLVHVQDGKVDAKSGPVRGEQTSQRAELEAGIQALVLFGYRFGEVHVYSDSQYLVRGVTSWLKGWRANGWRTKSRTAVSNRDMWEIIATLLDSTSADFRWHWISRGSDVWNTHVDQVVNEYIVTQMEARRELA